MYKKSAILTFYAETPIHMGTGQSVSYVDLPVQRERHTSFPVLWASGIKGVIRDLADRKLQDKSKVDRIFGPKDEISGSEFASCISITDAKILLYPVRSLRGVFAWITCPLVLMRFKDELKSIGIKIDLGNLKVEDNKILVSSDNLVIQKSNQVVLEEFVLESQKSEDLSSLTKSLKDLLPNTDLLTLLEDHLVVVSDNTFKDFVNYAVEVRTRIRIDQSKGTVEEGALFSEELIPSESIFYSLVFIGDPFKKDDKLKNVDDVFNEIKSLFNNNSNNASLIQLGGDETTGKGYMRVKFYF